MSTNNTQQTPVPRPSLSARVKLWLESGKDDALLDAGSKHDLLRELRDWLARRRRCNENVAALHEHYLTAARNFLQDLEQHADEVLQWNGYLRPEDNEYGMDLVREFGERLEPIHLLRDRISLDEKVLQPQADFLCESLSTRHGVCWDELQHQGPGTSMVVAALIKLGQAGVSLNALQELEDERPRKERTAEWASLRAKSASVLELLHELRAAGKQWALT